ncbi:MAG: Na/Pi cotransporter family protein [Candidatus Pacebacteria bacterium]|nr:Na/Pi cotransporter family protein [Candidatus Paceibacterota bacterium]
MTNIKILFDIVGGIALILYGTHLSGVNLQKMLGSYLEEILKKAGKNPVRGVTTGAAITGIINSGGTTTVMLFGLITGGIMTLKEAVPVMLGASIGSTLATQLASMHIEGYALVFLTVGVFIHLSTKKKILKMAGEAIIGLSLLFLGVGFVFLGTDALADNVLFVKIVEYFLAMSALKTIIAGIVITLMLQSAMAASILAVALGAASIIDLRSALFLVLGINLGSGLKVVYFALRGENFSGKLAFVRLLFGLTGFAVFILLFPYFFSFAQMSAMDAGRQIANAHTFYNIVSTLIFMPFVPLAVKISERVSSRSKPLNKNQLFYLDQKLICTPSVSLAQVKRGAVEMAKISFDMLESTKKILFEGKAENLEAVKRDEEKIDVMTEKITEYTIRISQQNLSQRDKLKLYSFMHVLADIEHLADHVLKVAEICVDMQINQRVEFSKKAKVELSGVFGKLKIMQNLVIKALDENNPKLANEIIRHENKVDEIIKKITANHQERIKEGLCSPEAGKYFTDILHNLERVGDHYDNVAFAVIDRFRHEEREQSRRYGE